MLIFKIFYLQIYKDKSFNISYAHQRKVKFIYSKKATQIDKIFTVHLTHAT